VLALVLENRAELAQHLVEAAQPHRDFGEVAQIRGPQLAEVARRRGQELEVERLGGRAARPRRLDVGGSDHDLVGQDEPGELRHVFGAGSPRLTGGARRADRRRSPGQDEAGHDLPLDRAGQPVVARVAPADEARLGGQTLTEQRFFGFLPEIPGDDLGP
jgi:hypothetical protein